MSVNNLSLEVRFVKKEKMERCDESRPVVRVGPREGEVKQSQTGDGGLHAVGQSPGAAVPREPRAQMAEELENRTRRNSEASGDMRSEPA